MKQRYDVMVDIETLGTKLDSTIFQIAAVVFNIETGKIYSEFNQVADISKNENLNVDGDTLKWWLKLDKDLFARLLNEGEESTEDILKNFKEFLDSVCSQNYSNVYLWGNGILFDNAKIRYALSEIGEEYPIHYNKDRDMRTILELASKKTGLSEYQLKNEYGTKYSEKHNAINDCYNQVRIVVNCYDLIMKS